MTHLDITCPDWCAEDPKMHADELWDWGGVCIHRSDMVVVEDPVGATPEPLAVPRQCSPIPVWLAAVTTTDGRPQATPVLQIGDREHTFEQAELLAEVIARLVDEYRREEAIRASSAPGKA